MEKVYEECKELWTAFIKAEKAKLPSYCWKYSEGDSYLRPDVYDDLMKRADDYYNQCLKERTILIPKN